VRGVLEPLEQELQAFAGLRVLALVVEDLRQDVLCVVEKAEVLVSLD
jgi:hypothetical protein